MNTDEKDEGTQKSRSSLLASQPPLLTQPRGGGTAVPRNKRQDEFAQIFELQGEELLEDYSCAYQGPTLLYHGRMYVSTNYICFHSQIFKKTIKILGFKDILDIQKKNTAILFPNAIEFTVKKNRKLLFASFLYREQAFKLVTDLWEEAKKSKVFKIYSDKEETDKRQDAPTSEILSDNEEGQADSHQDNNTNEDGSSSQVANSFSSADAPTATTSLPASPVPTEQPCVALPEDNVKVALLSPLPQTASPPSNSTMIRNLSSNISHNVNGWVHSMGLSFNKLRIDDGASEILLKKDIELKSLANDEPQGEEEEEGTWKKSNEGRCPTSPQQIQEEENEGKVGPVATPSILSVHRHLTETEAQASSPKKDERSNRKEHGEDDETEQNRTTEVNVLESTTTGSLVKTVVPVADTCAHISKGPPTGHSMLNAVLPIAIEDFFSTFFDEKNPRVAAFWDNFHASEPLNYTELFTGPWALNSESCCLHRNVSFRVPLKHPLGPKSTRSQQEQRIHFANKDTLVMEATATSLDVPYGDTFTTETRWVMSATNLNGKPATRVTVHVDVRFTKSVWIKGVIQSSAVEGISSYFPTWLDKAQRMLASRVSTPVVTAVHRPRKLSITPRGSKRTGEVSTKMRKTKKTPSQRPPKGEVKESVNLPASTVKEDATSTPGLTSSPSPFSSSSTAAPSQESIVGSLIRMASSNFSITAAVILLLVAGFFVLPTLFTLTNRVASLEGDMHMMLRMNTQLKNRVFFLQVILYALTNQSSSNVTEDMPLDTLPDLWRYWKLHSLLHERVQNMALQLSNVYDLLGRLREGVFTTATSPLSASSAPTLRQENLSGDEFLSRLARALDSADENEAASIMGWEFKHEEEEARQSWLFTFIKLIFLVLPLLVAAVALLANAMGLLPQSLPFSLPFRDALRPSLPQITQQTDAQQE